MISGHGYNRRQLLGGLSAGALAAATFGTGGAIASAAARPAKRPNILLIMADDLGFSDLGTYGGDIDTPNLDGLARRSMRFSNFYNLSRCCPSRASLLTGRYPHRVNMAGNGTSLSLDTPTVAEQLRGAGYATSMIGKWHLTAAKPLPDRAEHLKWINHQGHFDRDFGDKRTYPAARGFDYHWGIIWGVADYFDPFSLVENYTAVKSVPDDFYMTDGISDHAVSQLSTLSRGSKPFMMYLAYTAPHWPLMAPEPAIQKYLPRYRDGWNVMRERRYKRQVALGVIDPRTNPLPPLDDDYAANAKADWDALTPEHREQQVRKMATHAAMVEIMDRGIGRVIDTLKKNGTYDNTVILFLSDNGASPEIMTLPGYDRPSETRDGRKVGYGEYPGGIGTELNQTGIGAHWASASNTPFRWWKAESYQGGTHTPFFVHWPAGLRGREGGKTDHATHIVDVTPTLLEIAGVTPSRQGAPMDGRSFAAALSGQPLSKPRPLFFEHYGARAVIDDGWKLVSLAPRGRNPAYRPWALFNLNVDRTETRDLAAEQPETVARLEREWLGWAQSVGLKLRAPAPAGARAEA